MTEDQKLMWDRLMWDKLNSTLSNEVTLYWTRSQIFILIQAAAIPFVATQIKEPFAILCGCLIGMAVAFLWYLVLKIIHKWLAYWHTKLAALEIQEPQQTIKIFADEEFSRKISERFEIFTVMKWLIGVFVFAWIVLATRVFS